MADGTTLDPGVGGDLIAADDLGATGKAQWVKLLDGTDGGTQTIASGGGVEAAALRVTVASDSTGVLSVDDNGGTLSVDDGAGSLTVDNPTISVVGGGVEATAQRVTLASDSTGVLSVDDNGSSLTVDNGGTFVVQENGAALTALQLIDNTIFVDDAAFTPGTGSVSAVGLLADQTATDSVNEGDIGIPRMTLDRKQIVTVAPSADTEGLACHRSADIDETEEEVKASAGKVYGWAVYNDNSTEIFLQFWNATAANVTPGTTTPLVTFPLPAGGAANVEFANGITFDTAICVGATTGFSDAVAPATLVSGTVFYK
jgi:hypothetical protein